MSLSRCLAAFAALAALHASAGPLVPVADINRTIRTVDPIFSGGRPVPLGDRAVMTLCSSDFQCLPWVSDGTPDGTRALSRLPTVNDNRALDVVVNGNAAYWLHDGGTGTYELWTTDGTPQGTRIVPTPGFFPNDQRLASFGGAVYMLGVDGLWTSDGTAAGSRKVVDLAGAQELVVAGPRMFMTAMDESGARELWASDGTVAGTYRVKDIFPGGIGNNGVSQLSVVDDKVFFWAAPALDSPKLWVSDGTEAGTFKVSDIAPPEHTRIVAFRHQGFAIFRDNTGDSGLLRTDGTVAGTSVIAFAGKYASQLTVAADALYFIAGQRLWKSDGTAVGTVQALTLNAWSDASDVPLTVVGNDVYFRGGDESLVNAVYRSGGTPESTVVVFQGYARPWGVIGSRVVLSEPSYARITDGTLAGTIPFLTRAFEPNQGSRRNLAPDFGVLGGAALFAATDGIHGYELWRSDGTADGTWLVKELVAGPDGGNPGNFATVGPAVLFSANDGAIGRPGLLFRTDGTGPGTFAIGSAAGTLSDVSAIFSRGDSAFVVAGGGLWITDGSPGGAQLVEQFINYVRPALLGRQLVYVVIGANGATLLRISDGTPAGTRTLYQWTSFTNVDQITAAGNQVFFRAYMDSTGGELWRTDGTAAGTGIVLDLYPGPAYGVFQIFGSDGRLVFFQGMDPVNGYGLWRSDGTAGGTLRLRSSDFVNRPGMGEPGRFFLDAGLELLVTDGTAAGTRPVTSGNFYGAALPGIIAEGMLFFRTGDGDHGLELWSIPLRGSTPGLVQDLAPGRPSSAPTSGGVDGRALASGLLLFSGDTEGGEPYFMAFDKTPDSLAFPSASGVGFSLPQISAPAPVAGITVSAPASVQGGMFCVSGGANCACDVAPFATSGSVDPGTYVCLRHTSAATDNTSVTSTLTIGDTIATFTSTTGVGQALATVLAGTGQGRVVSSTGGIDCGSACSARFLAGTAVTLTATTIGGGRFAGWSGGGCSGLVACTVTVSASTSVTATFVKTAPAPRDLDGDGHADILWTHPSGVQGAWLMDGDTFRQRGTIAAPVDGARMAMTGDFDGDGHLDIVWSTPDGAYYITLMDGLATKASAKLLDCCTGWTIVGKGDFDGDGRTDLFLRHTSGVQGLWLMNGTTIAQAAVVTPPPGTAADAVIFADFDGDGRTDILWRHVDGGVEISLMSGIAIRATQSLLPSGTGWTPAFSADLDGDGKSDVLWSHWDGSAGAWLMDGIAIKHADLLLSANSGWHLAKAADLDGDGKADLVWRHDDGSWGGWLMDGLTRRSAAMWLPAGTGWSMYSADDLDGDGKADLVWRHASGQYGVWLMDGLAIRRATSIMPAGSGWEVVP